MATLQFVDSIASSPTLRLDINDGTIFNVFRESLDFSPPPLKRVRTATMLTDGDYIAATAYANRVIKAKLRVHGTSKDNLATNLQNLDRELDRKNNILKWQSTNATNPVFFRTFRSPDYKLEVGLKQSGDALNDVVVTLSIEAEPFAYGLRVTGSPVTVNNDPAAVSNPCYFDVTGVTGDAPTPAFIQIDPSMSATLQTLIATRRHGTPGGVYTTQCETMTALIADTTLQANDAVMSGAGSNYMRTTFATSATMTDRLQQIADFPGTQSVELRGQYKLLARLRRSDNTSAIRVQGQVGSTNLDVVTLPLTTNRFWIELGQFQIPSGISDPVSEGYSNTPIRIDPTELILAAARDSGAGTLDWDVVMTISADEEFCIVSHVTAAGTDLVLDGPNDTAWYKASADGDIYAATSSIPAWVGALPDLSPNQTNRIAFLIDVGRGTNNNDKTWTSSVTVSYWPRWLYIRP